jgi:hypothetical protein
VADVFMARAPVVGVEHLPTSTLVKILLDFRRHSAEDELHIMPSLIIKYIGVQMPDARNIDTVEWVRRRSSKVVAVRLLRRFLLDTSIRSPPTKSLF